MSKPAGASAVIAEVAKPHDLKHAKTEVSFVLLLWSCVFCRACVFFAHSIVSGVQVHDAGLQQAKLEREIKGKHELHHVDAPKVCVLLCWQLCDSYKLTSLSLQGGLSDAQKAAYLEDKKAGGKS